MRDRTKDKERFEQLLKGWVEQFAHALNHSDTKNYIQQLVIEPFLQFIFQRSFPYVVIAISIFSLLVILVLLIFIFLVFQYNKSAHCPFCEKTF
jgi:hypothetical protein